MILGGLSLPMFGRQLPQQVVVNFGATALRSSYSGAPSLWIPGIKTLTANGQFTDGGQPIYLWEQVIDGWHYLAALGQDLAAGRPRLAWVGLSEHGNPAPSTCWVHWPDAPAGDPFGTWGGGYSTAGVIGSSTWDSSIVVTSP